MLFNYFLNCCPRVCFLLLVPTTTRPARARRKILRCRPVDVPSFFLVVSSWQRGTAVLRLPLPCRPLPPPAANHQEVVPRRNARMMASTRSIDFREATSIRSSGRKSTNKHRERQKGGKWWTIVSQTPYPRGMHARIRAPNQSRARTLRFFLPAI